MARETPAPFIANAIKIFHFFGSPFPHQFVIFCHWAVFTVSLCFLSFGCFLLAISLILCHSAALCHFHVFLILCLLICLAAATLGVLGCD